MAMDKFENIREQILELLSHDTEVQEAVYQEVTMRFPDGLTGSREQQDEVNCLVQLRVYAEVLGGIVQ